MGAGAGEAGAWPVTGKGDTGQFGLWKMSSVPFFRAKAVSPDGSPGLKRPRWGVPARPPARPVRSAHHGPPRKTTPANPPARRTPRPSRWRPATNPCCPSDDAASAILQNQPLSKQPAEMPASLRHVRPRVPAGREGLVLIAPDILQIKGTRVSSDFPSPISPARVYALEAGTRPSLATLHPRTDNQYNPPNVHDCHRCPA